MWVTTTDGDLLVARPDALLRRWCKVASTRRHVPGRALRAQDLARVEAESGIPLADLIAFADANGWYEEGQL